MVSGIDCIVDQHLAGYTLPVPHHSAQPLRLSFKYLLIYNLLTTCLIFGFHVINTSKNILQQNMQLKMYISHSEKYNKFKNDNDKKSIDF